MREEKYIDKLLEKNQKGKIAILFQKGMSQREIATELNISEDYVEDLFEDWRFAERADQDQQRVLEAGLL